MDSPVRKRFSSILVLTLLSLVALAIGALALASSSGTTPAAGTDGRGGTAAVAGAGTLAGETTVLADAFTVQTRGDVPRPVAGVAVAPTTASTSVEHGSWIAAGVAAAALIAGLTAWIVSRRRRSPAESSMAAYCARHPQDAACVSA